MLTSRSPVALEVPGGIAAEKPSISPRLPAKLSANVSPALPTVTRPSASS